MIVLFVIVPRPKVTRKNKLADEYRHDRNLVTLRVETDNERHWCRHQEV